MEGVFDKLRESLDWQTVDIVMLIAKVSSSHMYTLKIIHF